MPATPVAIPSSVGYAGDINAPEFADLIPMAGGRSYGVADPDSWKVSVGTAVREVRIAPGAGFGHAVRDRSAVEASLTLDPVTAGARWDLIVVHRDWLGRLSTFDVVPGGTAQAIPANRDNEPGTADDQPLALARVQAGSNQITELIDLRVWGGDGGVFAVNRLVMQYVNRVGTVLRLQGGEIWFRCIDGLGSQVWRRFDVTEDTGWVELVKNGGWSWSRGLARQIGGIAFVTILASRPGGWSQGNGLAALPAGFPRPSFDTYGISSHGSGEGAEVSIRADGSIVMAKDANGDVALTVHVSYPVALQPPA